MHSAWLFYVFWGDRVKKAGECWWRCLRTSPPLALIQCELSQSWISTCVWYTYDFSLHALPMPDLICFVSYWCYNDTHLNPLNSAGFYIWIHYENIYVDYFRFTLLGNTITVQCILCITSASTLVPVPSYLLSYCIYEFLAKWKSHHGFVVVMVKRPPLSRLICRCSVRWQYMIWLDLSVCPCVFMYISVKDREHYSLCNEILHDIWHSSVGLNSHP